MNLMLFLRLPFGELAVFLRLPFGELAFLQPAVHLNSSWLSANLPSDELGKFAGWPDGRLILGCS